MRRARRSCLSQHYDEVPPRDVVSSIQVDVEQLAGIAPLDAVSNLHLKC